jgi:hypothetical protein
MARNSSAAMGCDEPASSPAVEAFFAAVQIPVLEQDSCFFQGAPNPLFLLRKNRSVVTVSVYSQYTVKNKRADTGSKEPAILRCRSV